MVSSHNGPSATRLVTPTGKERFFNENDVIVSKTDPQGRITYANDVFLEIAGYTEEQIMGQPHSIIRHPDMPRCVFKLLWDTIATGREIFAYVLNMARNGDHYWVHAHVTATYDHRGNISGYHSNRRVPDRKAIDTVRPIYTLLLEEERKHNGKREQVDASTQMLLGLLAKSGVNYDQFVWSLVAA